MPDLCPPPDQLPDMSGCDAERIHEIGAIQSAGFMVCLAPDWTVERASANAAAFLGRPIEAILGAPFADLVLPDAMHAIRNRLSALFSQETVERSFAMPLQSRGPPYDLAVHLSGGLIVIEAEPSEAPGDLHAGAMMRTMIDHVQSQPSVDGLAREAARLIQALTGYDRVMIYRFHPDLSGEVIAERARHSMQPFLGLRYPATDIPAQARALLVRNPVRILFDVDAPPSPLLARAAGAAPLDQSMSVLRAHSPVHLEYLRNMGVQATLTVSLLKNGALWGLVACHHNSPRSIGYERRTTLELFVQVLSLLIDRCEREELLAYESATRQITSVLLASVARNGVKPQHLADLASHLVDIVPCDGTASFIDGRVTLKGSAPTEDEFAGLRGFLEKTVGSQVYSTDEIAKVYPEGAKFASRAAGLLAIPISTVPRDYFVYFRKETISTILWAGDPTKTATQLGPDGPRLSPRKSFEAWQGLVKGKSNPWTSAELRAAEALQVTVLEVVLRLISNTEAEREAASQKQEMLIAELNHRVRNILGLIRGLISQSRVDEQDIDTFARVLGERVHALARAHDQITAKNWGPGSFQTLIATEAGAYLGSVSNTVQMSGPPVLLTPQALSTLALVIHELITNAAKYGALTGQGGHVDITWRMGPEGSLLVDWVEVGGPLVQPPTRRGFGSTIIEHSIPHELGGRASIAFPVTGVVVHLEVPAPFVVVQPEAEPLPPPAAAPVHGRLSGTVLVVEDNMIIALDAEAMLMDMGAQSVVTASCVADAIALLDTETPTFALLDVNLGGEDSFPVADRLADAGIAYIFASGYGWAAKCPARHKGRPFITKPYTKDSIAKALAALSAEPPVSP